MFLNLSLETFVESRECCSSRLILTDIMLRTPLAETILEREVTWGAAAASDHNRYICEGKANVTEKLDEINEQKSHLSKYEENH